MDKQIIMCANAEIEKQKFQCYKNPFFKEDVDIGNILVLVKKL